MGEIFQGPALDDELQIINGYKEGVIKSSSGMRPMINILSKIISIKCIYIRVWLSLNWEVLYLCNSNNNSSNKKAICLRRSKDIEGNGESTWLEGKWCKYSTHVDNSKMS